MADRLFDWNDVIENDSSFTLLPPGEYPFEVKSFERGEYPGGRKLPPCKKAVLTIEVDGGELGSATITHNLFLHSRCEGLLCEFFTAIGQRQRGEQMRMDWNAVPGSVGICEVGVRRWTGNDGSERESNEIKRFRDPAEISGESRPMATAAGSGFTPGAF